MCAPRQSTKQNALRESVLHFSATIPRFRFPVRGLPVRLSWWIQGEPVVRTGEFEEHTENRSFSVYLYSVRLFGEFIFLFSEPKEVHRDRN